MHEIKCIITGRVQMVMYRDFAMRKAKTLGVLGTVTNMPNRSVIVVAQGEKEKLLAFIDLLKQGPILASVFSVDVTWGEPREKYTNFSILY